MRIGLIMLVAAVAALLSSSSMEALSSESERFERQRPHRSRPPEQVCKAEKLTAAADYFGCLTRALNKATERERDLSEDDVAKCDARFDYDFERAEATGGCETPGGPSMLRVPIKAEVLRTAENATATTPCGELNIGETTATCRLDTTKSAINLETLVDDLSAEGVTDDTILYIEVWGGNGGNGNVCCNEGGTGGMGGYAQTTTTLTAIKDAYQTATLHYYMGVTGASAVPSAGGDGGTASMMTANNLFTDQATLAETLVVAGGGGGRGTTKACASPTQKDVLGGGGGHGGVAIAGISERATGAGDRGGERCSTNVSGYGGDDGKGGAAGGGNAGAGNNGLALLGGPGGNHGEPYIGWFNTPPDSVTPVPLGGVGGAPGDDAGGGGGGGGYGSGGGGREGTGDSDCVSGGGGGGASPAITSTETCQVAPTSTPSNPNSGGGFAQITFDLGGCK
jgi:hypothetical protein